MSLRRPTNTTASPLADRNENRTEQTHVTTAPMNVGGDASVEVGQLTRAQRAALPLSADVVDVLAQQHGVCTRPLAMRRIDTSTGRIDIVPVACGSTREDQCRPCADKARRLRMAQCRQGWHLDHEPAIERTTPSPIRSDRNWKNDQLP